MKLHLLTILMMAFAIVFVFSSCKKDKVNKNDPAGDGIIENAVTDVDGNTYSAVKLGDQVWMAENLRTTKYANGTTIPMGSTWSSDVAYRYYPNYGAINVPTYGYLYNWPAVMHNSSSSSSNPSGVRGICPKGWHIPSEAEWVQLVRYVRSQSQYVCGSDSNNIAKALASSMGWNGSTTTCAVGNNPITNNATGFSAVPAGFYSGGYSDCYGGFGGSANFWSATQHNLDGSGAYACSLESGFDCLFFIGDLKYNGFSVRCVRD